jgi:hypothetical protein
MQWHMTPESSMIDSFGYDNKAKQMLVLFKSGALYQYDEVSTNDYVAMKRAKSKGRRFNARIRNREHRRLR